MGIDLPLGCSGDMVSWLFKGPFGACYGLLSGLIWILTRLSKSTDHPSTAGVEHSDCRSLNNCQDHGFSCSQYDIMYLKQTSRLHW